MRWHHQHERSYRDRRGVESQEEEPCASLTFPEGDPGQPAQAGPLSHLVALCTHLCSLHISLLVGIDCPLDTA